MGEYGSLGGPYCRDLGSRGADGSGRQLTGRGASVVAGRSLRGDILFFAELPKQWDNSGKSLAILWERIVPLFV
jgi:hypothetical protein